MSSRLRRVICHVLVGGFCFSGGVSTNMHGNKAIAAFQDQCIILNTTTFENGSCSGGSMLIGCDCNISGSSCGEIHYCSATLCEEGFFISLTMSCF